MENSNIDLDKLIASKLRLGSNIYTDDLATAIRVIPKPVPDFRLGITELGPKQIGLVIWRDQVEGYNDYQRGDVMDYLKRVKGIVELSGLDCEYVAQEGKPPNRRA